MALTREEHFEAHGGKYTQEFLQEKHNQFKKRYDENNPTTTPNR